MFTGATIAEEYYVYVKNIIYLHFFILLYFAKFKTVHSNTALSNVNLVMTQYTVVLSVNSIVECICWSVFPSFWCYMFKFAVWLWQNMCTSTVNLLCSAVIAAASPSLCSDLPGWNIQNEHLLQIWLQFSCLCARYLTSIIRAFFKDVSLKESYLYVVILLCPS